MLSQVMRKLLPFGLALASLTLAAWGCRSEAPKTFDRPFDYCTAGVSPDEACHTSKRAPASGNITLARAIADKLIAARPASELRWDWGESVMLLGLIELYRVTGESKYRDYYKAYMDHHIGEGYDIGSSDTCAPTAIAMALLNETGEQKYRNVVNDALHYLYEVSLRTEEGGLNHLGTLDLFGITLWVDSLFMFGNLLTRWGEYANDTRALNEYAFQYEVFTRAMQKASGFYQHAYKGLFEQDENVFWGRGNAWVVAATYDHLRVRFNRREWMGSMRAALGRQVHAFIAAQDSATGLWWTILNRPGETYLETSATALFAYGLARGYRYGYAGDSALAVIKRAMDGVRSRITTDGQGRPVVTGISGPTSVSTFDYYAQIPQGDDISYGIGAVLLALVETSGLPLPAP